MPGQSLTETKSIGDDVEAFRHMRKVGGWVGVGRGQRRTWQAGVS